jgi:hypothetical protein
MEIRRVVEWFMNAPYSERLRIEKDIKDGVYGDCIYDLILEAYDEGYRQANKED